MEQQSRAINNSMLFFRRYGQLASDAGIFRLCFLRIDGKAIAMTIAAECDDAFWQFKIGYDESYKNCSPGTLLQIETVRHAAKLGLARYEFLGNGAWTKEWTDDAHPIMRLRYYPFNFASAAAFFADGSIAAGKRLKKRMRAR